VSRTIPSYNITGISTSRESFRRKNGNAVVVGSDFFEDKDFIDKPLSPINQMKPDSSWADPSQLNTPGAVPGSKFNRTREVINPIIVDRNVLFSCGIFRLNIEKCNPV